MSRALTTSCPSPHSLTAAISRAVQYVCRLIDLTITDCDPLNLLLRNHLIQIQTAAKNAAVRSRQAKSSTIWTAGASFVADEE